VEYQQFETWLRKLSEADRKFLEKHASWKSAFEQARKNRSIPKGFIETTMEILENGSESET
jgi:hypothetical protein